MTVSHIIEKTFTLNGFTYAAQYWGDGAGMPIIALHGWLDNSASFSVLAPQLEGVQLLALDLAGHGYSDHRAGLLDYGIWSEVPDIFAIADQMGWQRFALMGHSRGAMLAFLAAGALPERISHLILIDALKRSLIASEQNLGSVAVIVDPLDDEAESYYSHFGFIKLPTSGKMFLDMKTIKLLNL